ncbi:MAG: hypothetical protein IPK74_13000 [Deltaproteobacteria bacterium]|nr:hypothetical protein [Deltaproteobacteria bacterium]
MSRAWLRIEALGRALFDGVDVGEGVRRRVDLGVLLHCEDERPLRGLAALVDWRCSGALSGLLRSGFCTGEPGESVLLPGRRDLPAERWLLFGMGRQDALDPARAKALAERAVACALRLRPRDVLLALPGGNEERELAEAMLSAIVAAHEAALRELEVEPHEAVAPDEADPGDAHDDDAHDDDAHDDDAHDDEAASDPHASADASASVDSAFAAALRDEGPHDDDDDRPEPDRRGVAAAHDAPPEGGPTVAHAGADEGASTPASADDGAPHAGSSSADARSHAAARPRPCPLWLVADGRHAGRLRRFIEGPPRAAEE